MRRAGAVECEVWSLEVTGVGDRGGHSGVWWTDS